MGGHCWRETARRLVGRYDMPRRESYFQRRRMLHRTCWTATVVLGPDMFKPMATGTQQKRLDLGF